MANEYNLIRDSHGNKMIILPYALGFQPIGDFTFMAEQNTRKITGQLDQIGSALSGEGIPVGIRASVMKDLNALNDRFGKAAGAEGLDLSQAHLDGIIGF